MRLRGKRALITGGASGVGAATPGRFEEEGARVVTADLAGGDVRMDVSRAAWPLLVESRGSIAITASAVGLRGSGGQAAYCRLGAPEDLADAFVYLTSAEAAG